MREVAGATKPLTLAGDRTLPVPQALAGLLPGGGLRRGTTVAVTGSTSVALALAASASAAGSWCAAVGLPALGMVAAAEMGLDLSRVALVPHPGDQWATVTAALVDALDIVLIAPPARLRLADARRLDARARERGSVLIPLGDWPQAGVRLHVEGGRWEGLGTGHGSLRRRAVTVVAGGRGAAARTRRASLWLPSLEVARAGASGEGASLASGGGSVREGRWPENGSAPPAAGVAR